MATFKAIVFQTGRHIKQDGTSNIKIRIYHNRESQYIATSYYIRPENMDDSGRILPNVPNRNDRVRNKCVYPKDQERVFEARTRKNPIYVM